MNLVFPIIDSIEDKEFNFKKLLSQKDIIIWKNCSNLKINVDSKINKFIFQNCKDMDIVLSDAIIGVEFNNCSNIRLKIKSNKRINSFELFKSDINLSISKRDYKKIVIFKESSKLFLNNNICN